MAAYIVATVRIFDPARFADDTKENAGLGERFGGVHLVRGVVTDALDGVSPPGERVIASRYPDAEATRA